MELGAPQAHASADRRNRLLAWLPDLAEDPYRDALPVPGRPLVHVRLVPACRLAVTYLVAEQYHEPRKSESIVTSTCSVFAQNSAMSLSDAGCCLVYRFHRWPRSTYTPG